MLEFVLTSLNVSFFIENINIPEWNRFTAFSLQDSSATTIRWWFKGPVTVPLQSSRLILYSLSL